MLSQLLAIGMLPTPVPPEGAEAPAAEAPASPKPVPWDLLVGRRLEITSDAGTTREGIFLGIEDGAAILEADDGTLISIAQGDVTSVRTVRAPPPTPTIPIPPDDAPLSFRDAQRLENERIAGVVRKTAIAGGVVASLSAAASVVAEGFNVARWSLSKRACGNTYYSYSGDDEVLCGWTDGTARNDFDPYGGYDNISGMTGASTIAAVLHVGGLLTLVPPTFLRERTGHRGGRRRHLAAWAVWGMGVGSLAANQAVVWTQNFRVREICDDVESSTNCRWITRTRGAPPGLFLLSAGLTLTSAILGMIDGRDTARAAERSSSRASSSVAVFPVSFHRGGGLGIAGKF